MKGLYANPIRTSDIVVTLLLLLGMAFLCLCAVNYFVLHISASLNEIGRTSFESHFPAAGGNYATLRRYALGLQDQRDEELAARLKTLTFAMGAFGVLFIIWGIDRWRLARRLAAGSAPVDVGENQEGNKSV